MSAVGNFLSECPSGVTVLKCDFRPMKNCAAVSPLSYASSELYSVSVATSSCRLGTFRIGLGESIVFRSECPCVAPRVPYCVVASKVFFRVAWSVPGKYFEYSPTSSLVGVLNRGSASYRGSSLQHFSASFLALLLKKLGSSSSASKSDVSSSTVSTVTCSSFP